MVHFSCRFAYYRAMHHIVHSAVLRSHVVRPSVSLSVTLVDQDRICWKSWKLIAQTISPTPSFFVAQRPKAIHLLPGERGEILGNKKWGKVACWSTKAAISLKRVKIQQKILWRAYRNSPYPRPLQPHLPQDWVFMTPTQNSNRHYLRNG